ncbi:MAG: hypothetical protein ACLP9S_15340 [Syntrophales bacterium]
MRQEAIVISWLESEQTDRNLATLASAMGIAVRTIALTAEMVAAGAWLPDDGKCVLATSNTLTYIMQSAPSREQFESSFLNKLDFLFVIGFSGIQQEDILLAVLTRGALTGTVALSDTDSQYAVNAHSKEFCPFLAGLTFGPVNKATNFGFVKANNEDRLLCHIQIGKHPFFVELETHKCRLYLLACSTVADIDVPLPLDHSIRQYFSHVIPEMCFLRHVFLSHCWQATERFGCFIVDDPLLIDRYGFLEYRSLLEAMDQRRFFTTVAFIPWNYRRTRASTARFFIEHPDRFSLSVHGCNHTEAEYGSESHEDLMRRTQIACQRMALHRDEMGIDFDRVMVFPMGYFSTEALRVLKSCNFLAAVNSTADAVDQPFQSSIRELLELPALQYEGFSVFLRRYPKDIADFALDLFLGKPVLIVEHHDYFKGGPTCLADFVSHLNTLASDIHWCGLGAILEKAHLEKTDSNGVVQVKFYTHVLRLQNRGNAPLHYVLRKREAGRIPVNHVLRDGIDLPFSFIGNDLMFELDLPSKSETVITAVYEDSFPEAVGDFTLMERFNAFVRRHLTEFRDNHISKSTSLMHISRIVKKAMYRGLRQA